MLRNSVGGKGGGGGGPNKGGGVEIIVLIFVLRPRTRRISFKGKFRC